MPHLWVVSDRSPAATNDAALAEAIRRGDAWGLEQAWKRYSGLAFGMLRRGLGEDTDAELMTQEIFLSLGAALRGARDPESLRKWVIALSARRMLKALRSRRLRRWLGMRRRAHVDLVDTALDRHSRLALLRLHELMEELGPGGRTLLVLAEFEGLGETDIADALGWSLRRVVKNLTRAREWFEHGLERDPLLLDYVTVEHQNQSEISEGA